MPFKKGQSGNPGGRPKQEKAVVEAARAAGDRCIEVLRELVEHGDPKVRMPPLCAGIWACWAPLCTAAQAREQKPAR